MKKVGRLDKLTIAARGAAIWFIKYLDYGDESINWQNGDSEVFAGSSDSEAQRVKRDLKLALASRGISAGQLVSLANHPPHTHTRGRR